MATSICACCGEPGQIIGFGWREACYTRWRRAGKPDTGPPPRRRLAQRDRLADYAYLVELGVHREEAARRVGLKHKRTIRRYESLRKARKGDLHSPEPIVRGPRIITCDSCGEEKEHHAHGWCVSCWKRWDYSGRPDTGPPPRQYGRWEEYLELTREQGYSLRNAAARMGITKRTAQRYEARLRQEGVPPIAYESSQIGVLATRPMAFSARNEMTGV
jgi:transposase-like protein